VITTDTDGWVEYLNPVAEALTGWTAASARGLPLHAILRTVDETTRKLTSNPIEMVLREERTIEVSAPMLLVRNDSSKFRSCSLPPRYGPHRQDHRRGPGHARCQPRTPVRRQAFLPGEPRCVDRLDNRTNSSVAWASRSKVRRNRAGTTRSCISIWTSSRSSMTPAVTPRRPAHAPGQRVLLKRLREGDTLARLGGDEFGVLLENCPPDHALRIADQLRQTVTDFHFTWETRSFGTGVSIGLVNVRDRPFTLTDVMSAADAACYMARKRAATGCRCITPKTATCRCARRDGMDQPAAEGAQGNRFVLYAQDIKALDAGASTAPTAKSDPLAR